MLSYRRTAFLLLLTCAFGSCLFKSSTENIVDDYQVTWINSEKHRALYKHEKIIPAYVFAIGHTPKFIIAKQHPLVSDSSPQINTAVVNYYIIERTKNVFQDKPLYGPLTESEYKKLCYQLQIDSAVFTKVFPKPLEEQVAAK